MKVKHLIRELNKCNQEADVFIRNAISNDIDRTFIVEDDNTFVTIKGTLQKYNNYDDTPYPIKEELK